VSGGGKERERLERVVTGFVFVVVFTINPWRDVIDEASGIKDVVGVHLLGSGLFFKF
jgi:hypothetical protein